MKEGLLVVISSPSGGGKTSIANALRKRNQQYRYSVSVTTRPMRDGEIDGQHYHFTTPDEFRSRIDADQLAEWAQVHGHYYGTPRAFVDEVLREGQVALFDLDVQGGLQIKKIYPQSVLVFVLPPSPQVLEERLRGRRSDAAEVIRVRLENARKEVTYWPQYDYVVINNRLPDAVDSVQAIIEAECHKADRVNISYDQ
jgi:guanylate kinase